MAVTKYFNLSPRNNVEVRLDRLCPQLNNTDEGGVGQRSWCMLYLIHGMGILWLSSVRHNDWGTKWYSEKGVKFTPFCPWYEQRSDQNKHSLQSESTLHLVHRQS